MYNAILQPAFYEQNRVAVNRGKFLIIEGTLQKQDGVVSVKASAVGILALSEADLESHDSRQVQSLAAKCCMEIQGVTSSERSSSQRWQICQSQANVILRIASPESKLIDWIDQAKIDETIAHRSRAYLILFGQ